MTAELSAAEVAHVAHLARLELSDDQLEHYRTHLQKVLDHAAEIDGLDLDAVEPTAHPIPIVNRLRDDTIGATLDRHEVLGQAPDAGDGAYFRVPPILGEQP